MSKMDASRTIVGVGVSPHKAVLATHCVLAGADATFPLFKATQKMVIKLISVAVQTSSDGVRTIAIKNATKAVDVVAAVTVVGVTAAALTLTTTASDLVVNAGDVVTLAYDYTSGSTAPGQIAVTFECTLTGKH